MLRSRMTEQVHGLSLVGCERVTLELPLQEFCDHQLPISHIDTNAFGWRAIEVSSFFSFQSLITDFITLKSDTGICSLPAFQKQAIWIFQHRHLDAITHGSQKSSSQI